MLRSITLVSVGALKETDEKLNPSDRPTMCRHCGAIVGAGETHCGVCGLPTTGLQTTQPQVDRETLKFARAVLDRPYKFTIIILIANLFVFLLMWQSSGTESQILWQGFPEPVLIGFGAKVNAFINDGEWWRFVTPIFIHVNLPHLLVNMYSLWVVGPYVERLYGSAKFVVFWVLTGIAGVVGSYLTVRPSMSGSFLARFFLKAQDVPSAGASGALFGLVGVLFIFGIKFRRELPYGFKRAFGTGMLPIILINLFIGYIGRGFIDNAAHVGGLLAGAVLAVAVQYRRPGEHRGVAATWRVLQGAVLGLIVVSFFLAARHLRLPPVSEMTQSRPGLENPTFTSFANTMNAAQEALTEVVYDNETRSVDPAITALDETPSPDPQAEQLRQQLRELLVRAKAVTSSEDSEKSKEEKSNVVNDYDQWKKNYADWLKTTAVPVTQN